MSTMMKLIIPFLDESLTKEDFDPDTGFFGAFTEDINRPYIEDCIFLMYKVRIKEAFINIMHKMSSLKSLYKEINVTYKGESYVVYAIKITNPEVRHLLKGLRLTKYDDIMKVVRFWNFEAGDVNRFAFDPTTTFNYEGSSVPEEDYVPTLTEIRLKQKAGIPVNRNLSLNLF